jgi:hypothetical protein
MRRPSNVVFIGLILALCVALVAWQRTASNKGVSSAPAGAVGAVLRVTNGALNGVGGWFGDAGRTVFQRGSIVDENRQLRAQVADLTKSDKAPDAPARRKRRVARPAALALNRQADAASQPTSSRGMPLTIRGASR